MDITITGFRRARRIKRRGFNAVLTLEDPLAPHKYRLRFHSKPAPDHLVLRLEDIDTDDTGFWLAEERDVLSIIEFGRRHRNDRILVHCFHGVGRSGAAAYIMLMDSLGDGEKAFDILRSINPEVIPNLRLIRLADRLLGTGGAMTARLERLEVEEPGIAFFREKKARLLSEHPDLYARAMPRPQ